jgi:hypothetical protein
VERILISNAATVAMEGNTGKSISGILHLQSSQTFEFHGFQVKECTSWTGYAPAVSQLCYNEESA